MPAALCNVHIYTPRHLTGPQSRLREYGGIQYKIHEQLAPRLRSSPLSEAAWILFGSDLTFRDRNRFTAMEELADLAGNTTLPIVTTYFALNARVRGRAKYGSKLVLGAARIPVTLPRPVYFLSELEQNTSMDIVLPFVVKIGAALDKLSPPAAWSERRTALFVGHIPQLEISTTRWQIWRQLYHRSDAYLCFGERYKEHREERCGDVTLRSHDVYQLGVNLDCIRNGSWHEHCSTIHGQVSRQNRRLNCDARPRSPASGRETHRCFTARKQAGFPRDFLAAGKAIIPRRLAAEDYLRDLTRCGLLIIDMMGSIRRPPLTLFDAPSTPQAGLDHKFCIVAEGDYPNSVKYIDAVGFASRGGCVPVFVGLKRSNLAFGDVIDYDRVALWSTASSLGSNLKVWSSMGKDKMMPKLEYAREAAHGKTMEHTVFCLCGERASHDCYRSRISSTMTPGRPSRRCVRFADASPRPQRQAPGAYSFRRVHSATGVAQ